MKLNEFVPAYIEPDLKGTRDYEGDRGWIHLVNLLLRKLESKKLYHLGRQKERGVEVDDDYWITLPTDYRKADRIYYPPKIDYRERDVGYHFETINGRLKLEKPFDKKDSPDTFTLSAGSTTQISINDTDATLDLWKDYLLKLTHGTYSGNFILIKGNAVVGSGVSVMDFLHTQDNTTSTATTGYLTNQYLMLKYFAQFTPMSLAAGEIPLQDQYEDELLANWLRFMSLPAKSKERKEYKNDFLESLDDAEVEENTPESGNAAADARELTGMENMSNFDQSEFEYKGSGA